MDESNGVTQHLSPGQIRVIEYAEQCRAENRPFTVAGCVQATRLKSNTVLNYRSLARQKGIFPEVEDRPDRPAAEDVETPVTDLLAAVRWTVRALRPFTEAERTAVLDLVREILT